MIDVNSSKSTVGSSVEENAVNTNREAAVKIADMMRLRDIGRIIHIDFIDMNESLIAKVLRRLLPIVLQLTGLELRQSRLAY